MAVILALYACATLAGLWRLLDEKLFTAVIEMAGVDLFTLVAGVFFTLSILVSVYLLWRGRIGGVIALLIAVIILFTARAIEHFYLGSDWKLLFYHLPLALFFAILLLVSWRSINTTGHSDEWRSAVTSENSEIEEEA
ncbi:MAG: hypothetical protein O3C40_35130 [Planctomycetota bacterium]|nr:hypothetical protein [Planctomycetota bacterium]